MSLYDIDRKIAELIENGYNEECIDAETGEFLEGKVEELLSQYECDRELKIENIALYIKNLNAEAEAIKLEEKKLADRRKAKENKVARLEEYLANSLISNNETKFESARCSLSFRKSVKVIIADEKSLPVDYIKEKIEYTADKTKIKKDLQRGVEIAGATLEEKQNLQIK